MTQRIFFLNTRAEGVGPAEADRFLRERDIPMGRSLRSITRYEVTRLDGTIERQVELPSDYLDVVDVASVDEYRSEIRSLDESAEWQDFVADFDRHIGHTVALYGRVVGRSSGDR